MQIWKCKILTFPGKENIKTKIKNYYNPMLPLHGYATCVPLYNPCTLVVTTILAIVCFVLHKLISNQSFLTFDPTGIGVSLKVLERC